MGWTWTCDEIAVTSRVAIKARGCRCDVELDVRQDDEQLFHITARHDDWCPLLLATRRGCN